MELGCYELVRTTHDVYGTDFLAYTEPRNDGSGGKAITTTIEFRGKQVCSALASFSLCRNGVNIIVQAKYTFPIGVTTLSWYDSVHNNTPVMNATHFDDTAPQHVVAAANANVTKPQ